MMLKDILLQHILCPVEAGLIFTRHDQNIIWKPIYHTLLLRLNMLRCQ